MKTLAVFVSGGGTNLQAILDACADGRIQGKVGLVVADNTGCYAIQRAELAGIPVYVHDRKIVRQVTGEALAALESQLLEALELAGTEMVVLAGYLSVIPDRLVQAYERKIINIHPALIPKYSGKGWYGDKIHQAVLEKGDTVTGVTVHYVDSGIDTGAIIEQVQVPVLPEDTLETLRDRIHTAEHPLLIKIVAEFCKL